MRVPYSILADRKLGQYLHHARADKRKIQVKVLAREARQQIMEARQDRA